MSASAAAAMSASAAGSASELQHPEGLAPELCAIADKVNELVSTKLKEMDQEADAKKAKAAETLIDRLQTNLSILSPGTVMVLDRVLEGIIDYNKAACAAEKPLSTTSSNPPDELVGECAGRAAATRAYNAVYSPASSQSQQSARPRFGVQAQPKPKSYVEEAVDSAVAYQKREREDALAAVLKELSTSEREDFARYQTEKKRILQEQEAAETARREKQEAVEARALDQAGVRMTAQAQENARQLVTIFKDGVKLLESQSPKLGETYTWQTQGRCDMGHRGPVPMVTRRENPLKLINEFTNSPDLVENLAQIILHMRLLELRADDKPYPKISYAPHISFASQARLLKDVTALYHRRTGAKMDDIPAVAFIRDIALLHQSLREILMQRADQPLRKLQNLYDTELNPAFMRVMEPISDKN